jgi:hypothetical protein
MPASTALGIVGSYSSSLKHTEILPPMLARMFLVASRRQT